MRTSTSSLKGESLQCVKFAGMGRHSRLMVPQRAPDHQDHQSQQVGSHVSMLQGVQLECHVTMHYRYKVTLCSVAGISVVATVVETLCYTVIIGYNWNNAYPVSSYGAP